MICFDLDFFSSRFLLLPISLGLRLLFNFGVPFKVGVCCLSCFYLSSLSLKSLSLQLGDFLRVQFLLTVRYFLSYLLVEKLVLFSFDLFTAFMSFSQYFFAGSVSSLVIFLRDLILSSFLSLSFSKLILRLQSFLESISTGSSSLRQAGTLYLTYLECYVISMFKSSAILLRLSVSTVLYSSRLVLQCFSQLVRISVRYLRLQGMKRAATITARRWQLMESLYSRQNLRSSRFFRNNSTDFSRSSVALLKKQVESRMILLCGWNSRSVSLLALSLSMLTSPISLESNRIGTISTMLPIEQLARYSQQSLSSVVQQSCLRFLFSSKICRLKCVHFSIFLLISPQSNLSSNLLSKLTSPRSKLRRVFMVAVSHSSSFGNCLLSSSMLPLMHSLISVCAFLTATRAAS